MGSVWPSYSAALDEATVAAASAILGTRCLNGTATSYEPGSELVSGSRARDYFGFVRVPIEYTRHISFFTERGEACAYSPTHALWATVQVADGAWESYPECRQSHKIRITRAASAPESATVLQSIDPAGQTDPLVLRVYDQANQPIPNVPVKLEVDARPESGGHHHGDDMAAERTGKLSSKAQGAVISDHGKVLTGSTGNDGLAFTFHAPAVAGDIKIEARCTDGKHCAQEGPDEVWVGVKGLIPSPASPDYVLIGETSTHPDNHYLAPLAAYRLTVFANAYARLFPEYAIMLHVNDASLERRRLRHP